MQIMKIQTTDRELLELAAKAAGMPAIQWGNPKRDAWDPLGDDGDALRLAVKLGMGNRVLCLSIGGQKSACEFNYVAHGSDAYAATRRAIVTAAAEIGKTLL